MTGEGHGVEWHLTASQWPSRCRRQLAALDTSVTAGSAIVHGRMYIKRWGAGVSFDGVLFAYCEPLGLLLGRGSSLFIGDPFAYCGPPSKEVLFAYWWRPLGTVAGVQLQLQQIPAFTL